MSDIVDRLRDRAFGKVPDRLSSEAADEIESLRNRISLWERCAGKTIEMYGGCVRPEREREIEAAAIRLAGLVRLTDAEREAVKNAADRAWRDGYEEQMDTLRGLLERTK